MWMSGTSFSAPIVSGAAALILAKNPNWTPDKVKGALMLTARPTAAASMSLGVGELNAKAAFDVSSPPNPNLGLNQFVGADGTGGGCLRLGKLGELGQRKRLLEPGFMESGLVEPGVVGQRLLERSQLEPGFLESGELVLGLLERCQLGSRFLGRGELERGELGSRFLGGVGMVRRTERG